MVVRCLFGIIPALAGNTARAATFVGSGQDHPRSRGEYWRRGGRGAPPTGSSPLSRGIHLGALRDRGRVRIIPALAGNTGYYNGKNALKSDHPRSRGEYFRVASVDVTRYGSSPLSRGIPQKRSYRTAFSGIIPALAGNTAATQPRTSWLPDHPRSRGEYASACAVASSAAGSSPLSRGIRGPPRLRPVPAGIIPALAGNTRVSRRRVAGMGDHPRSRGEYPCPSNWKAPRSRIIPALAGNTLANGPGTPFSRDHPRSRGEYQSLAGRDPWFQGSSPLSRGIRRRGTPNPGNRRIIPALAGNTRPGIPAS